MDLNRIAARLFADVLAEFAFLCGERVPADRVQGIDGSGWVARLRFQGTIRGTVAIAVPEPLARELAANALGLEPGDPEVASRVNDAVRELASLLGGHLATAFPGTKLSPPDVAGVVPEGWDALRVDTDSQAFAVGEHHALLRFAVGR